MRHEVAEKAFEKWNQYKLARTFAFCSSNKQADFLAKFFKEKGIKATSFHSQGGEFSSQKL